VGSTQRPWWSDPDPDPAVLRRLYVDDGRTEREIARLLSISQAHLAASLADAGIERRTVRRLCPVDARTLAELYSAPGATVASLARRFDAASDTLQRWLAVAGLLPPDPRIDHARLRRLYVDRRLTVAEVAHTLGIPRARVQRALVVAGVGLRSNRHRPPRGKRAALTDARLERLYLKQRLPIQAIAERTGVSTLYVQKRLREVGLVKRLGSFTPRCPIPPDELRRRAAELYETGLNMQSVGRELGVSVTTVRRALHEARVPVRRSGPRSHEEPARTLVDDLYADPDILAALRRNQVAVPGDWAPTGPFESLAPLPLSRELLRELYEEIGLAVYHIALLLGVGNGAARAGLLGAGIRLRRASEPAPWTLRRALMSH
jgi:transposase-like protein